MCVSPLPFYKCLSDDTRLKMLLLLSQHNTICVCDLQQALNLSQPKISRHLAELRKCNLVSAERRGKWMYYQLCPTMADWQRDVLAQTYKNAAEYLESCLSALPQGCCD